MSRELQAGQRIRVTVRNRLAYYQSGDKGTVWREGSRDSTGGRYYLVAMDKDGPDATERIFLADEIEPDM
jgi:hypothetical protein